MGVSTKSNFCKTIIIKSDFQAFFEALNILEVATKARQHSNLDERSAYFNELKAMRENWRIRKVNEFVFGDLGYRICTLKITINSSAF